MTYTEVKNERRPAVPTSLPLEGEGEGGGDAALLESGSNTTPIPTFPPSRGKENGIAALGGPRFVLRLRGAHILKPPALPGVVDLS